MKNLKVLAAKSLKDSCSLVDPVPLGDKAQVL
jgi:hypothetical protein